MAKPGLCLKPQPISLISFLLRVSVVDLSVQWLVLLHNCREEAVAGMHTRNRTQIRPTDE
jgi:hypothetical protein